MGGRCNRLHGALDAFSKDQVASILGFVGHRVPRVATCHLCLHGTKADSMAMNRHICVPGKLNVRNLVAGWIWPVLAFISLLKWKTKMYLDTSWPAFRSWSWYCSFWTQPLRMLFCCAESLPPLPTPRPPSLVRPHSPSGSQPAACTPR